MTPNEITTAIAVKYNKVLDMPFKLALMVRVDVWRSRLIRNTLQEHPKDRKFFTQTIYVKMTKQREVQCDLPVKLCDVALSEPLPEVLRANGVYFDFVGAINGSNAFYEVGPGIQQYISKGRYTGNRTTFTVLNDQIAVLTNPDIPMIRVDAIWDNPTAIAKFICTNGLTANDENCDYWNKDYPATREIIQQIIQMIEQMDLKDRNLINLEEVIHVPVNPKTES
jgi:hypothetical protein